ncbi:hypothetical protein QN239_26860 [Mycolicibacterium sp. Y3]
MDDDSEIDDYVDRLVADTPPLTADQRARLVELLRPVRMAGAA